MKNNGEYTMVEKVFTSGEEGFRTVIESSSGIAWVRRLSDRRRRQEGEEGGKSGTVCGERERG